MTANAAREDYQHRQDQRADSRELSFEFFMCQMEEEGSADYLTIKGEEKTLTFDEFMPDLIDDAFFAKLRLWWAARQQGGELKRHQAANELEALLTSMIESAVRVAVDEEHEL